MKLKTNSIHSKIYRYLEHFNKDNNESRNRHK